MVYYFTKMQRFQIEELKIAEQYMSEQRKAKINRLRFLKEKKQSAIAYLLLRYGLKKEYGITETIFLDKGSWGKPYLSNYPLIHFNMSHCEGGVACIIDDYAVGIDITLVKKENLICMQSAMSENEIDHILQAANSEKQFTIYWSLKESYCKYLGIGIGCYIKDIDFSSYTETKFSLFKKKFQINEVDEAILTWCANTESKALEIDLVDLFGELI